MPQTILIIDDEHGIRQSLRGILEDENYQVAEAANAESGLALLETLYPDLIFLDVWLPGMDGLAALERIKQRYSDVPVVMISGHGNIETAVQALRAGAHDFVEKPLSLETILTQVRNTLEIGLLRKENQVLRATIEQDEKGALVGSSPPMIALLDELGKVAPTDAWVLITGENGTGKELAAKAVYRGSKRADAPLVTVNCAAIPEELIESELFGHERGAFTGADKARTGKFELAHKGTLFLDEIGDMSLKTQAKILRILQEQTFERVGGSQAIKVDVRVIAATNKNLEEAINQGAFRTDLYYRLRVFPLHMPPLRERAEDIPLLLNALALRLEKRTKMHAPTFSSAAMAALQAWPWPGNVRELAHLLERLTIIHNGGTIQPADLPTEIQHTSPPINLPAQPNNTATAICAGFLDPTLDFKSAKSAFETWYLQKKLAEVKGNMTKLAELVGLERSYLHRKLKAGKTPDAD